jgi:D-alanine-D-alanine ligase
MKRTPLQVVVLYSTPTKRQRETDFSETDEDTSYVAGKVAEAIAKKGMRPSLVALSEDTLDQIDHIQADCVFNLMEWTGLDIPLAKKVFARLRKLGLPVTGCTEDNYMDTSDKTTMKTSLQKAGIPTPQFQVFQNGEEAPQKDLHYPILVKPAYEHGSIGIGDKSIAYNAKELGDIVKHHIKAYSQPALAEEFIIGRELLVYMYEEKDDIHILPIEEITFSHGRPLAFQTYEGKWDKNHPDYEATHVTMAQLSKKDKEHVEAVSREAFRKLGFRGYTRFDIRLREGIPYVLETNANPNIYDSDEDQIPGIPFPDFVKAIVDSALYHFNRGWKI